MTAEKDILGVADVSPPSSSAPRQVAAPAATPAPADPKRLSALVEREFDFVWRIARRLGMSPASAEDVAACLLRELDCRSEQLLENETPRLRELLGVANTTPFFIV